MTSLIVLLCGVLSANAQITITNLNTSDCYPDAAGTSSKATIRVLINWATVPASNPYVRVSLGTQTRDFLTGSGTYNIAGYSSTQTIVSPQEIAFEVPADGTVKTVSATFGRFNLLGAFIATGTPVSASTTAPPACPRTPCSTSGLGGVVFNDYNADGVRNTVTVSGITSGETNGVANVEVRITAANGLTATTLTDEYGYYAFTQPLTYPVRVEFANIPAEYQQAATPNGTSSRTTTQFITAASCTVNLGVNSFYDFCNLAPKVFTPCYVNGNPTGGGDAGQDPVLVATNLTGSPNVFGTAEIPYALGKQIGATWGLAFNRNTKKLFSSAVLRRHVGLGPLNIGGVYITDVGSATTAATSFTNLTGSFLNLAAAPVSASLTTMTAAQLANTGAGSRLLPAAKGISGATGATRDAVVFTNVGKQGLGDLEISDDGNTLYAVNLLEKKLISVDISTYNATSSTANVTATFTTIPNPGCILGEWRPWALKYYRGKLYVGGVCDASGTTLAPGLDATNSASLSAARKNLKAVVYEYDGTSFTSVFDFPLTYPKGFPYANYPSLTGWYPWTDDWSILSQGSTDVVFPQPMFSDIEFDIDGSMLLGFGDRTGFQTGVNNYSPVPTDNQFYLGFSGGDVLKAYAKNGVFILENNGKAGPFTGSGAGNNQGPGFGEYFNDNWSFGGTTYHAEAALGALALRPGSGQTVATSIDPVNDVAWSSGFRLLNNNTGLRDAAFSVYTSGGGAPAPANGTLGKAAGLGDVELNCDTPTYLEIGNRVWYDLDNDGVQDPTEKGISGVSVKLYAAGNATTPLSTTTTDANGEYYFTAAKGVQPNQQYIIVIGDGQQVAGLPDHLLIAGRTYVLTVPNTGEGPATYIDQNDSDAEQALAGLFLNKLTIPVSTSAFTVDNHRLDAGFSCIQPTSISLVATSATCNGTTPQNNGSIVLSTSVVNGDKYAIVSGTVTTGFAYSTATAIGTTFPKSLTTGVSNAGATYTVRIYNGSTDCYVDQVVVVDPKSCVCIPPVVVAAASSNVVCTTATALLTATVTLTGSYTYAWIAPAGATLTGANTATATASGFTTGLKTFTVTVTSGPGCFTTATVSLSATACLGCSISLNPAIPVQSACNDNGTATSAADDYFTVTVQATAVNGGASGKYEVVIGANLDGTGGTVLNAGGTAYSTAATVGTATTFMANGSSTYLVTVRDLDTPTCKTTFTTTAVQSCSVCPPQLCIPMTGLKQ
ncbi:hypothetical protein J2I47_11875 [Fibrella sp. HMF5335]|uniref:SD-repeat containing protein B domain-containing protein n=1 Tax=Fibrella rubiginis TaxID=2817060 RepID=A0A939GI92_9BACT|nr:SdrD B-like domain-containing protein [Fibrella rubiginis]MBO0937245.1 hypothetical protein [Fibrella rubiginis]